MITPDTLITDLIKEKPEAEAMLASLGLHCVGCMSVEGENFLEACKSHGLDPVMTMRQLNLRLYGSI